MAENKKSFVAYTDWNETFKKLTDEEAGRLSKMMFAFVADEKPIAPDRITELLFEPIKQHLKRDLKKYEVIKNKRSEIGRTGGLKSGEKRSNCFNKEANEANASKRQANEAVNVNDNDNVNGMLSSDQVFEFLSQATFRTKISSRQLKEEAAALIQKYEGTKVINLRSICNEWASRIKPETKKMVI